jgi:hypothetical protein
MDWASVAERAAGERRVRSGCRPARGGTKNIIGNSPFAMAVPTTREWPMVLDMATSVVAGGKLHVAGSKGEPIPLGWARDKDGNPTTDPVAARAGSLETVAGLRCQLQRSLPSHNTVTGLTEGRNFGGIGYPACRVLKRPHLFDARRSNPVTNSAPLATARAA